MNKLIVINTEDQGCFLYQWNEQTLGFALLSKAAYGRQGQRFCLMGESEKNFSIWYLDVRDSLRQILRLCQKVEEESLTDQGIFFLVNDNWFFRNFEDHIFCGTLLGQKLIPKKYYYYLREDGYIQLRSIQGKAVECRIYDSVRIQEYFDVLSFDMPERGAFFKKDDGSFDIINTKGEQVQDDFFKEYFGSNTYRLFLKAENGSYAEKGIVSFYEDWDNGVLVEDTKTLRLYQFTKNDLELVGEGSKKTFKCERDYANKIIKFRLGGYSYSVQCRIDSQHENRYKVMFNHARAGIGRKILNFYKNIF